MYKISKDNAILPLPPTINSKFISRSFVVSSEYRNFKDDVKSLHNSMVKPKDGTISLTICFFRKYKKGDVDGRIKPLMDALQGIYYHNDSQVEELHVYNKQDKENPRCEIIVEFL